MTKTEERELKRKLRVLEHARQSGNVARTCRYFGIPRSTFYFWRNLWLKGGERALLPSKPIPKHQPNKTPQHIAEKILYLRCTYHLGPHRIMWYNEQRPHSGKYCYGNPRRRLAGQRTSHPRPAAQN